MKLDLALGGRVSVANARVRMSDAARFIGMRDVDYASSGAKVDCPFTDVYHPGSGKSFRMYDDASAYCYACGERYSPVQLVSRARDLTLDDAAEQLLEFIGYSEPSADDRWAELTRERNTVHAAGLSEALNIFCSRLDHDWEMRQFDDRIASKFRQCIDLLPNVRSAEEAKTWMNAAKTAMKKVLET